MRLFQIRHILKKPVYAPCHSAESNRKSKNHWLAALPPGSRAECAEVQLFVVNSSKQQSGTSFLVPSLSSATRRSPFAIGFLGRSDLTLIEILARDFQELFGKALLCVMQSRSQCQDQKRDAPPHQPSWTPIHWLLSDSARLASSL